MTTRRPSRTQCLALTAAIAIGGLVGEAARGAEAEAVEACLRRSLPDRASKQTVTLVVSDPEGELSRARARVYWKRFENGLAAVQLRFTEPPQRAGMAMLSREQPNGEPETFLYLPELRQTRRVSAKTAAGSMFGTDFSYEDFAYLQGVRRAGATRRLEDGQRDGRAVYRLETRPEGEDARYERIVHYIEIERCVPLATEFFEGGERLRKVYSVDLEAIEKIGTHWIPMHSVMRDLEAGTQTDVRIEAIDPDARLRDRLFEPAELEKGGR